MNTAIDVLVLRLDAPLMSFGAPVVDERGKIQPFPAQSLLTGMIANALGYDRSEHEKLQGLQKRLRYAVREDRRGQRITDFQTVDLTLPHMSSYVWTTLGTKKRRTGKEREILYRDYWADAIYTVALTLEPTSEEPTLDELERAVQYPARPLFIGRKPCLPSTPLFVERIRAEDLVEALRLIDLADRADNSHTHRAWWPTKPNAERRTGSGISEDMRQPLTDRRDWANQIHVGERWVAEGDIKVIKDDRSDA